MLVSRGVRINSPMRNTRKQMQSRKTTNSSDRAIVPKDVPCLNTFDALTNTLLMLHNHCNRMESNMDVLDEGEDGIDLGEDSFGEDEEDNMLDICFVKVARDGDVSPIHRRS
ncbi:hypothetical protein CQW23_23453 [Capsicum baccatum]|uniref:Uncharacterized protein n=1 Tax=Capsicum baccatum TaxID=33114 RepID=A0A2G2VS28_CAPBA|nr:hypothetical protein CQW23_23453 [Capsicum baccatum]